MFDPRKLHRAQTEDVRKILFAAPKKAWAAPGGPHEGVAFEIHSSFELDSLCRAFPTQFRDISDAIPQRLDRWARVHSAGGFTRTDEMPGGKAADDAAFALESPELGAVYVDVADKSYIHFSSSQLPQGGLPTSLKKVAPKWEVTEGKDTLTLSVRGVVSLDVVIECSTRDKSSSEIAAIILSTSLPGLDELAEMGLPLKEIMAAGTPKTVETWLVNDKGQRGARLARHRVSGITTGPIDSVLFSIPEGFRNLRDRNPESDRAWHPLGSPRGRTRRGKPARGRKASAEQSSQARAAYTAVRYQAVGQVVPAKFSTEPVFPECFPSTLHASSALEIRQSLLDTIQFVINLVANRLDTTTGTRVDPGDPENTDVELTIDWLAQLEQFHQSQVVVHDDGEEEFLGDGLFCLLRDPPPDNDRLGGGKGLLDKLAETLARRLVAAEDPIPLGGEDDPVALPQAIEDRIAALSEDDSIPPAERFNELPARDRARVREEVLAQRIATINYQFDGGFGGEQQWPSRDYDLVHFKLQLEQLAIEFSESSAFNSTIRRLLITLVDSDADRPRIEFELALERLEAVLTMERYPGAWFWVTAAGALVALAIVGSLAVTGLILTLIGLGPLGLLVLMTLLSQAPVTIVAGGALILAVVTYLVWDVTQLRLILEQPVLRSSVSPDQASDPEEVVLVPDRVSLDGEITVSVNSEIPSGIHQLFDAVINFAVSQFDALVREPIEAATVEGLRKIRDLPHFRLPQPSDAKVRVELVDMSANGVPERLLSAGALTRMEFPFPAFAPHTTQVDRDLREKLTARMEQVREDGRIPRLGYAISQNLLNDVVFSQWLAGRFVVHYDNTQINEAFSTLIDACSECADISEREVHVWAAASPLVFVTERAYLEQETKPYLSVFFPDVRVCISGVKGKSSTLEIRFSIETIAHVAFGGLGMNDRRTFFSLDRDFLNVLFDDNCQFRRLSPVGTQGLEVNGPGFDSIAAMDDTQRVQFLQDLQPLLETAAVSLLKLHNVRQISFVRDSLTDSNRFNQQVYDDGVVLADIQPCRASLFVVVIAGTIALVIPRRDENDQLISPSDRSSGLVNLGNMTCKDGESYRDGF